MQKNIRAITSSSLGNILEAYDFGLFTIFAAMFSRLFFPEENAQTALIMTFGISAAGFLCRPIGALIFGYIGDTLGRVKSLRLSILMTSIPTLLIGLVPNYQQIGITAPIILVILRMWQGVSIGGEYSGNFIYLAETAPTQHRAFCASFASVGASIGFCLAGIVGFLISYTLSPTALEKYGWRILFVVSGIICLLIYRFRLNMAETSVFETLKQNNQLEDNPFVAAIRHNKRQIMYTLGLVCFGTTFYYFCFAYIPVYLSKTKHYSVEITSGIISIYVGMMIFLAPLGGWLCDRFGRRKMLLVNASAAIITLIPGFYFLQSNLYFLLFTMTLFTMISSFEQGTTPTALVESFPASTRYTGIAIGFSLGNGILGGTAPMISAWLVQYTNHNVAPAFYISLCAIISLTIIHKYITESKGISLHIEQSRRNDIDTDASSEAAMIRLMQ